MDKFIVFKTREGERRIEKIQNIQLGMKSTFLRINNQVFHTTILTNAEIFESIISFLKNKTESVLDVSK